VSDTRTWMLFAAALTLGVRSSEAALVYTLVPNTYSTLAGASLDIFATLSNTGPDTLTLFTSSLGGGSVPSVFVSYIPPPAILAPFATVPIASGTIGILCNALPGTYTFFAGAEYKDALTGASFSGKDGGTITVVAVPEPGYGVIVWLGLLYRISLCARSLTKVKTPRAITSRSIRANQISTGRVRRACRNAA
jgi:hypothetical protein